MEHLFLRCFLSPNGKERTDCIPPRFGPSLRKMKRLVLHRGKASSEILFVPQCCDAPVCKLHIGCGSVPFRRLSILSHKTNTKLAAGFSQRQQVNLTNLDSSMEFKYVQTSILFQPRD